MLFPGSSSRSSAKTSGSGRSGSGVRGPVSLSMLPEETAVGDWVLVHVGFAIARIDEDEAMRTLAWLEGLGQAYADELQSFKASGTHADLRTA